MSVLEKPLTNLQIELLKLFSLDLSNDELQEVRRLIANYFAEKASAEMDKLWEDNKWSNQTMDEWLSDGID